MRNVSEFDRFLDAKNHARREIENVVRNLMLFGHIFKSNEKRK